MRPRRRTTWQSGCRNFNAPMDETTFILYQLQQIEGQEQPKRYTNWSKFDTVERRSITIPGFASISKTKEKLSMKPLHIHVLPQSGQRFSQSMESFAEAVSSWPGMYFEMDGSFVWVPESTLGTQRSQIDGMIYDRNGFIEYVDLKGSATEVCWLEVFIAILGQPATTAPEEFDSRLRVHTVAFGAYLSVSQFLKTINDA